MAEAAKLLEKNIREALPERDRILAAAALATREHIVSRTRRGIGVNERRFVPYSPEYARRKRQNLVDLTSGRVRPKNWTGHMLDFVTAKKKTGNTYTVEITEPQARRKATIHHFGRGRVPARPFFGTTSRFANELSALIGKDFEQSIRNNYKSTIRVRFKL